MILTQKAHSINPNLYFAWKIQYDNPAGPKSRFS